MGVKEFYHLFKDFIRGLLHESCVSFTLTGVDKLRSSKLVCDIYFNGSSPCGGGMMALDGRTGQTLWMHWAEHEIFSLNCGADLDQDGINDCIGGGRAGVRARLNKDIL